MHYVKTIKRILQTIVILQWIALHETSYTRQIPAARRQNISNPNGEIRRSDNFRKFRGDIRNTYQEVRNLRFQDRASTLVRPPPARRWNRRNQPRGNSWYSRFSAWGQCDMFCKQKRVRHCVAMRKCGHTKQVEERLCPPQYCTPLEMEELGHTWSHKERDEEKPPSHKHYNMINLFPSTEKYGRLKHYQDDDEDEESEGEFYVVSKPKRMKKPVYFDDMDYFDNPKYTDFRNDEEYEPQAHTVMPRPKKQRRKNKNKISKEDFLSRYYNKNYDRNVGFEDRSDNNWKPIVNHKLDKNYASVFDNFKPNHQSNQTMNTIQNSHMMKLYDSFPKLNYDGTKVQNKRETHEDVRDDDEYSDEETGKKTPDESMLKIGNAGRKRVREKAVFEVPRRYENHYSKWSRWSKCTAKCTTRRIKKCKQKTICGNDVIREIAYCYTEGSFCEEWIGNQLYNTNSPLPEAARTIKPFRPAQAGRKIEIQNSIPTTPHNFSNRRGFLQPEYTPQNFQCGIPVVRNKPGKSYIYNMLRIIGGKTARRGQWPWQVVILNRFKEAFCGGTLVSSKWILTAAHCVRKRLHVRLGEHNLQQEDGTEIEFRIETSIKHPKYDKKTVDNDVALLRLPKEMEKTNFIGYACLPERYQLLPTGHTCTIIGWGKKRHNDDAGTNLLHEAEVPIITNDECRAVYHDYTITKNMFCAGHKRGRIDTCAGDSGGPLLCRDTTKVNSPWTIFGITSFGDGCGKKNKFGIYTKLPNYVDWIWSVINCNGNCRP